ncbi:hypothetical protein [Mucilaginibacter segetis]|nr:hypothetical protein [Mucilaginibacter segetis]
MSTKYKLSNQEQLYFVTLIKARVPNTFMPRCILAPDEEEEKKKK